MIADYLSSTPRETYLMIWFSRYGCFKTWSANVCVSNVEYKCEVTYVPEASLNYKLSVTDFIGDLQIDIRTVWRGLLASIAGVWDHRRASGVPIRGRGTFLTDGTTLDYCFRQLFSSCSIQNVTNSMKMSS